MKKAGFKRVRPLQGGLAAWRDLGFPTEDVAAAMLEQTGD
jgi:3-mercaptopyruvate sulfurtransferase SseA